ncbi:hypothetical protein [Kluyvera ascorbata]|uniref:hypothetical protein n=1 Tax=Kluyvera ascorbata TaxID=51288 RepID=UPI0005606E7D|nr:hypothetical protein [Kluyvera ascorbata]EJG2388893.1 hypothetical protein [Kluyvera ascorbata]MDU1197121.1 hypothetical protein [Kluyvera ascorbata]BCA40311.1 hypothetical protein KATP_28330 [Kluyvera ascorbata]HBL0734891.1 hypothetical protein [Kluyvera ascorbata]
MKTCLEFINLASRYILVVGSLTLILIVLKYFNLTTLGSFGILALILTIIPGFSITRKYFEPVTFKGKKLDLLFLSGVAVAIVALPVSIFDSEAKTADRLGYGIIGVFLIYLIIKSVLNDMKKKP